MEHYIGQKFDKPVADDVYFSASCWCSLHNAYMEDKETYFEICEIVVPPPTKQELAQFACDEKGKVAYGGLYIVDGENTYLFATDTASIALCSAQKEEFLSDETKTEIDWKVYKDDFPTSIVLSKAQFLRIYAFGIDMLNQAFTVENTANAEIAEMTDEQLRDEEYIDNFKTRVTSAFAEISREVPLNAEEDTITEA